MATQTVPTEAQSQLLERIGRAAEASADAEAHYQIELARRDELIVEANDTGAASIRKLAKAAGLSVPGIYAVLSRAG